MTIMKTSLVTAAVLATLGAGTVGATSALAASHQPGQNHMNELVTAIAQKFHLAPADIQAVVDEQQKAHADAAKKLAETRIAAMLAQAVKDGKLTQAQSDLIAAKQKEIIAFQESLKDKTEADRQTAMTAEKAALKTWAATNNIPEKYLLIGRPGMGRGMEEDREMGPRDPKTMLDQAVKAGKLTQAQEDLLLAKHTEIRAFEKTLSSMTAADRKIAITNEIAALKAWATANNIPEQYAPRWMGAMNKGFDHKNEFGGRMMGRGMGRR